MRSYRILILALLWLILSASRPYRDGIEIEMSGGGGYTEHTKQGCGTTWAYRSRMVAGDVKVRYGSPDSGFTAAAEGFAYERKDIAWKLLASDYADPTPHPQNTTGFGGVARMGWEWSAFALDGGVTLLPDQYLPLLPLPTLSFRYQPAPNVWFYASLLEDLIMAGPIRVGAMHEGEKFRLDGAVSTSGDEIGLFLQTDFRVADPLWLGTSALLMPAGHIGSQWLVFGRLTYAPGL